MINDIFKDPDFINVYKEYRYKSNIEYLDKTFETMKKYEKQYIELLNKVDKNSLSSSSIIFNILYEIGYRYEDDPIVLCIQPYYFVFSNMYSEYESMCSYEYNSSIEYASLLYGYDIFQVSRELLDRVYYGIYSGYRFDCFSFYYGIDENTVFLGVEILDIECDNTTCNISFIYTDNGLIIISDEDAVESLYRFYKKDFYHPFAPNILFYGDKIYVRSISGMNFNILNHIINKYSDLFIDIGSFIADYGNKIGRYLLYMVI